MNAPLPGDVAAYRTALAPPRRNQSAAADAVRTLQSVERLNAWPAIGAMERGRVRVGAATRAFAGSVLKAPPIEP